MIDNSNTPSADKVFPEVKENRLKVQRALVEQQKRQRNESIKDAVFTSGAVGALDLIGNSFLQDKAQHYYKENQQQLFRLQQQSQINAPSNEVEGLRRAGLSTALAGSPTAMSIGAVSAPQASTRSPAPDSEFGKADAEKALMAQSVRLSLSEQNVKDNQARLLAAQTQGQELENENMFGANYVAQTAWSSMIDNWIADAENRGDVNTIAGLTALRDGLTPYLNAGAYQFMQGMMAGQGDYASAVHNRLATYLDDLVLGKQIGSEEIINSLAIAPYLKNAETRAHIVELGAASVMMMAQADLNSANAANARALNPAYQHALDKVLADIRLSGVKADEIHNSDLQTAVKNGDWGRVASIATEDGVKIAANALGFYLAGRGMRKAAAPAAPAAPSAPTAPAPEPPVFRPDAKGGAARKAEAAADNKAARDTWDSFYKGYKSAQRYRGEHSDYPKRKPKPKPIF